jgi:hypothetical protein
MYIGRHLNYPPVIFSQIFEKEIQNFTKIRPVGVDMFHAEGLMDGQDKDNTRFSQFCESA